jgi:hypothetical protein
LTHPTQGQVVINAQGAKLSFNLFSNPLVGRDLQIVALLSSEDNFQQQPAVTITSSDPSRMLVSTSATAPGQASVIIPAASGQPQIFLQSLADNGTATLSASANGYQSGTMTLTLAPAAAVFQTGFTQQTISTNSPVQTLSTVLAPLDPATLRPVGQQIPRPGANLSIAVTSSDPKVLIVDTPTLKFPVDSQQQTVQVRPTGPGTAILSLGALPGGVMPGSSSQIVFNVAEPDLFIPNFSVGRDLQVPVQVTLGSRLPTPTSDVTINVSEFGSINLSTDPALFNGSQTIPVVIPAGQRVSRPFYVQGAFPSVTNLSISGTGYNTSLALVTVTSTAFVFQEANQTQPISIANGATTTLNVVPVLSPLGTPPSAPMTIRAGAQPIIVNVTSSNPAVLGVSTPQITLRPGDQRAAVTVRASAPGSATLTLSGAPAYDFGTVQSSIAVSVK